MLNDFGREYLEKIISRPSASIIFTGGRSYETLEKCENVNLLYNQAFCVILYLYMYSRSQKCLCVVYCHVMAAACVALRHRQMNKCHGAKYLLYCFPLT